MFINVFSESYLFFHGNLRIAAQGVRQFESAMVREFGICDSAGVRDLSVHSLLQAVTLLQIHKRNCYNCTIKHLVFTTTVVAMHLVRGLLRVRSSFMGKKRFY